MAHSISLRELYDNLRKGFGVKASMNGGKEPTNLETSNSYLRKWASGCQYKCLECGKVFFSDNYLGNHIRVKHSLSIQEYKEAHKVNSVMTKRKQFECNLCSSSILHNPSSLKTHARGKHQMSLSELRREHVAAPEKEAEETPNNNRAGLKRSKWANGCEYKCLECDKVFLGYGTLVNHIDTKHSLSIGEYKAAHKVNSLMTYRKQFKCNLCSSFILHNPSSLKIHARAKHQMSLSELRKEHVAAPEKEAEETPNNNKAFSTLSKWANCCEYKCLECDRLYRNYKNFLNHIDRKHSLSTVEYKKAHNVDVLMTKRVYFRCNLCRSLIVHNTQSLTHHSKNQHGLTLSELHLVHVKAAERVASSSRRRPRSLDDWLNAYRDQLYRNRSSGKTDSQ